VTVIWAASWPRSGSTLWRIVWHTYTGLPTFSYANDPILNRKDLRPYLDQRRLPRPVEKMGALDGVKGIYMVKTHQYCGACDPDLTMRRMLVVRDVRDTIVSLAHYTTWRKKRNYAQELERIIRESTWTSFVGSWYDRAQAVVRYEEMKAEPKAALVRVLADLDLDIPVNGRQMPEFRHLHGILPDFFRKGQAGGWRSVLNEEQEARIWARHGELMETLGYER
jgi:hypothetical protein